MLNNGIVNQPYSAVRSHTLIAIRAPRTSIVEFGVPSAETERFIKWLFFYVGEQIVKSTKTDHDDLFLAKIKEAYEDYDHSSVSIK